MSTPETDALLRKLGAPTCEGDYEMLKLVRKLETERDELRAKLQYVTGQLIEAGCDDGAAPVEELARRTKKDIAGLRAEVERLKADKARLDNPELYRIEHYHGKWHAEMRDGTQGEAKELRDAIDAAMKGDK